jgi:carboxymethylenebutenolidase
MNFSVGFAVVAALLLSAPIAEAGWQQGEFQSGDKPVSEHHCTPETPGAHPAVIILYQGLGYSYLQDQYEDMCLDLAEHGYFAESIEYFSQTGVPSTMTLSAASAADAANLPTFEREVKSGLDTLAKNPAVDSKHVALMGFSMGAYLALAVGAQEHQRVAAVVEYYGALYAQFEPLAKDLPPTLILHGSGDQVVSVSSAHRLDQLMSQTNRPHEIYVYPMLGHGFNFANGYNRGDWWDRTLEFLDKYLKPGT